MTEAFLAVCWKEIKVLQRAYRKFSSYVSTLMYVVFFGVFPAWFLQEDFARSSLVIFYLSLAPLVTGAGMATLAFAGERENHTLETLLSTPLSGSSILMGKIAVHSVYAWLYSPVCLAAGWITAVLLVGHKLDPDLTVLAGALWVSLLVAIFSTCMGTLASLRSGTIKEAGRRLQFLFLLFMVPYIVINFLPDRVRMEMMAVLDQAGILPVVFLSTLVLVVLNLVLIRNAARSFVRSELILD